MAGKPGRPKKRERVGFGGHRTRLQLSQAELEQFKKDGYHVHWINDEYGAVQQALGADYEFVHPSEARSVGSAELHEGNTDLGEKVSKIVSKGNPPVRAYLMKLKQELYDEDRKKTEELNAQVDRALKEGHAGGANIENQYTPEGGGVSQKHF